MPSTHLVGLLIGLSSSVSWGGGDFFGGLATRRINHFQVLVLASATGFGLLVFLTIATGESLPPLLDTGIAGLAGIAGALGIAIFYRALSIGSAAVIAPTAAVIGALIPVVLGIANQGLPPFEKIAAFVIGGLGIWTVTVSSPDEGFENRAGFSLAVFSGVGFGVYIYLIAQVKTGDVYAPLAVAKAASLATALVVLRRQNLRLPSLKENGLALLAGAFDVGGNIFYLLATRLTRLDIAAVLSSMYPATTVLLSAAVLKQRMSKTQMIGVGLCLSSVALIAI